MTHVDRAILLLLFGWTSFIYGAFGRVGLAIWGLVLLFMAWYS